MVIGVYDFNAHGRSHKSVGVDEVVQDAIDSGVNTISVISSGNYVRTIRSELDRRNLNGQLRIVNLINGFAKNEGEVGMGPGRILRDAEERQKYVSGAFPGGGVVKDYTDFQPRAYDLEVGLLLASNPDYISLGVGSGKLFLAFRDRISSDGLDTKLIGVLPEGENGVFNDDNLFESDGNLYFRKFRPRNPADKLVCPYTSFKGQLLDSRSDGHLLVEVSKADIKKGNRKARKLGYDAEMSGSAGFVVYDDNFRARNSIPDDASILSINTGRGFNWEATLRRERIWRWLTRSTVGMIGLGLIGLVNSSSPSQELMAYADLDRNGVVTEQELLETSGIVGSTEMNDHVLLEMRDQETMLRDKVIAQYDSRFDVVSRDLIGIGGSKGSFDELSFDHLRYLNRKKNFMNGINPELWSNNRLTSEYRRLIDINGR